MTVLDWNYHYNPKTLLKTDETVVIIVFFLKIFYYYIYTLILHKIKNFQNNNTCNIII